MANPAAPSMPPAGLTSEFASTFGPLYDATIGLRVAGIVLTTLFIAIRTITRQDMSKFETEDCLLILAYIFNVGKSALFLATAAKAASSNISDVSNVAVIAQESYAMELMYIFVLFFAKSAMLFQLRRTFAPWKSGPIYIMYCSLLWLNLAFTIVSVFGMIFQCVPLPKMWDPTITGGYCVDRGASIIVSACFNLGTDVTIFILPLWSIFHLKKGTRYRLSVGAVFATALLAIVASAGRTVETVGLRSKSDETNHFAIVGLWSAAETVFLIICPCFLFMPRFLLIVRGHDRPQHPEDKARVLKGALCHERRWFKSEKIANNALPWYERTAPHYNIPQSAHSWSSKIPV